MKDSINPDHYKANGMEVVDIIEAFAPNIHRSHAIKYLLRAGKKGNTEECLNKCKWWIDREISKIE